MTARKLSSDEKTRRAARAKTLMNDPLIVEAFNLLEIGYFEAFRHPDSTPASRENLWQATQVIRDVQKHLGAVISSGKLERREVIDIEQAAKAENKRRRTAGSF